MRQSLIRWLDKNIGCPVCFGLTLQRRVSAIFRRPADPARKPSKILFIKLIEQGSTVLAWPALKKAVGLVGSGNVYFMVFKQNRPVLDILDILPPENILEIDSRSLAGFIASALKALARARREKIDAVIDMEFFSRASAVLSYLAAAQKRVGLHRFGCEGPYRGDLFTHKLLYNPYLHIQVFFLTLVEALNHAPGGRGPLVFEIPPRADEAARFSPSSQEKHALVRKIERLKQASLTEPIVLLNPNAADLLPIRRWPQENFIDLGKMIRADFPQATIVITGTAEEKQKADEMAAQIGALSLAGRTSLRELLTLYCISQVLVTNDSGPGHFSSLTPLKAIILFGPETPFLYGQLKEDSESVAANFICSPCVNVYNHRRSPCKEGICLRSVKVEDIYQKVKGKIS